MVHHSVTAIPRVTCCRCWWCLMKVDDVWSYYWIGWVVWQFEWLQVRRSSEAGKTVRIGDWRGELLSSSVVVQVTASWYHFAFCLDWKKQGLLWLASQWKIWSKECGSAYLRHCQSMKCAAVVGLMVFRLPEFFWHGGSSGFSSFNVVSLGVAIVKTSVGSVESRRVSESAT